MCGGSTGRPSSPFLRYRRSKTTRAVGESTPASSSSSRGDGAPQPLSGGRGGAAKSLSASTAASFQVAISDVKRSAIGGSLGMGLQVALNVFSVKPQNDVFVEF